MQTNIDYVHRLITKYKLFLIVSVGSMLLLAAWVIDISHHEKGFGWSLLIEGLKTLGVTGFAVAGLNLWIETEDWTSYFERRIKSIVIQQDYFIGLDNDILKNALRNLMKARFRDESVSREDGFLDHFEKNIVKYIGSPYREDIHSTTTYSEAGDSWLIQERLEFICRKSNGGIQQSIFWSRVNSKLENIKVYITRPSGDGYGERELALSSEKNQEAQTQLHNGYSLENYKDTDKLRICIECSYYLDKSEYMGWNMSHPGRNVDVLVVFPEGHKLGFTSFLVNDTNVETDAGSTFVRIRYKGWLLPENGLVWHLTAVSNTRPPDVAAS